MQYALLRYKVIKYRIKEQNATDPAKKDIYRSKRLVYENKLVLKGGNPTVRQTVLVTAPHSFCSKESVVCDASGKCQVKRTCDRNSQPAAEELYNHLLNAGTNARLIINNRILRHWCDMNRPECRNTSWRRSIKLDDVAVLVDVHSFPADDDNGFGRTTEVVFLELGYGTRDMDILLEQLNNSGIPSRVIPSHPISNDIITQASTDGVPVTLLVEFREDLTRDRLKIITQMIAGFIKERLLLVL